MSKLVDDAVSDYFTLLLTDDAEVACVEPVIPIAKELPYGQQRQSKAEVKEYAVKERVSSQALEQLLAPVSAIEEEQSSVVLDKVEKPQTSKVQVEPKTLEDTDTIAAVGDSIVHESVTAAPKAEEVEDNQSFNLKLINKSPPPSITKDLIEQLDDEFQVLFFKVAGLTLAVPLVSLGGIVNLERINHLMGRPSWYLGVQQHRDSQLNVVDTCAWVMPEKYDDLAQNVNYQYIVVLQDSSWGLTCESLVNTVKIHKSQVNWRSQAGKRPWLAGVVKEQMCGILNVDALIAMLDSGLGSQG